MQPFIVKINDLARGTSVKEWRADGEFFGIFGNPDILGADLEVEVTFHNHGTTVDVECDIDGTVTVACDRCLEDLELPVETGFEESYVPESDELDLSQDIYDYVCIALPLQKVHAEGQCNPDTIKYLSTEEENNI